MAGVGSVAAEELSVLVEDLERALEEISAGRQKKPSWRRRILRLPRKLWPKDPRTM